MGNNWIFQFLYINVLNYRYFLADSYVFLNKKTFINVYYNYVA